MNLYDHYRYSRDFHSWYRTSDGFNFYRVDPREAYEALRRAYRKARRADAQWQPDPYADRWGPNDRIRPDTAGAILRGLPERWQQALKARPNPGPAAVARGPRSNWYANWYPRRGRYMNLNLQMRVAFRASLRKMFIRNLEREGADLFTASADLAMFDLDVRLAAITLKRDAELARIQSYAERGLAL